MSFNTMAPRKSFSADPKTNRVQLKLTKKDDVQRLLPADQQQVFVKCFQDTYLEWQGYVSCKKLTQGKAILDDFPQSFRNSFHVANMENDRYYIKIMLGQKH